MKNLTEIKNTMNELGAIATRRKDSKELMKLFNKLTLLSSELPFMVCIYRYYKCEKAYKALSDITLSYNYFMKLTDDRENNLEELFHYFREVVKNNNVKNISKNKIMKKTIKEMSKN